VTLLLAASACSAQSAEILQRLDRLEAENKRLSDEIAELRKELASSAQAAPLEERVAVQETRTTELDQKKVQASQKMPIEITGMLLFNAFRNGANAGTAFSDPTTASATPGLRSTGATLRQTVLGLRFFGPDLPGGGKVSGSVDMDFFSGSLQPSNNVFHLRVATIDLAWKDTTITVGQDKPIVAPREPVSLAQVGVSPLTGAGNLWQWQPQARIEQRFRLSERSEIRAQAGVFESYESANTVPAPYTNTLGIWRPAYEARLEYAYSVGGARFEIAPGFHDGASRVAGQSVASRAFTIDGLAQLNSRISFDGAWFTGENLAGLGTLRQGFTILPSGAAIPVHLYGGWVQATYNATARWSFHLFAGDEDDRASDLIGNGIGGNFVYGGNSMWQLAPNVLASFEFSQARTDYLLSGTRLNNHYDLALAYRF
jgi:uncharacterized protein (UPF0335 family)